MTAKKRLRGSCFTSGFPTADQFTNVAQRMHGKRLRYRDLIKPNGLNSGARELAG